MAVNSPGIEIGELLSAEAERESNSAKADALGSFHGQPWLENWVNSGNPAAVYLLWKP